MTATAGHPGPADPPGQPGPDRAAAAEEVRRRLWGDDHRRRLALLERFEPEHAAAVLDGVFGGIYADPRLSLRERSLCTVAVLMALGRDRQLASHVEGALRLGVRADELSALAVHVSTYAGLPAALDGLRALASVLDGPADGHR